MNPEIASPNPWPRLHLEMARLQRRSLRLALLALAFILLLIFTSPFSINPSFKSDIYFYPHHDYPQHEHEQSGATYNKPLADYQLPPLPGSEKVYSPPRITNQSCAGFPNASNLVVVMKTGASESYARLPTQLMIVLKCLPEANVLLFGDLHQDIAGYDILDSLDNVTPEIMDGNPDFDLYRWQKACVVNPDSDSDSDSDSTRCERYPADIYQASWNLDRYKNVHIVEKTFALRPGLDWYVFVDADTYLAVPNLVWWLVMLNPAERRYLGSVTEAAGDDSFRFGHGGSGYVLSRGAMESFAAANPGVGREYDSRVREVCCGDQVLGLALKEKVGLEIEQMVRLSPTF